MYRQNRAVVEAPAKINLHLSITGVREDGYHLVDTVLQAVDLCDLVVVGRSREPGIRLSCRYPGVPEDSSNLAVRAAEAFFSAEGISAEGLNICIDKHIPHGAGLGGGSSDAAAVLVGLNKLYGGELTAERLCEIGGALGADVPFFIRGGCALAEGIGDRLSSMFPGLRPCWLVIAMPDRGVNTAEAYRLYDSGGPWESVPSAAMQTAIATGNLQAAAGRMFNIFERVTADSRTAALRDAMKAGGSLGAVMTGSGSAVAGVFADRETAERCMDCLEPLADRVFLTAPVQYGARVVHLS